MFEEIMEKHMDQKTVTVLCKKLLKRCSFDSGADAENLCRLAYWLYIYGDDESAMAISSYTHDTPFPGRAGFNVWTFLLDIWGLECYILQKRGQAEASQARAAEIDRINRSAIGNRSAESVSAFTDKIRARTRYEGAASREKIESAGNESLANGYRLAALFHLIGWGATGHYPDLNLHREEMEQDIQEYISILRKA